MKAQQLKIALRNCGEIDPEKIQDYIAKDGYQALSHCLFDSDPRAVTETIKQSGLRGRGGG